MYNLNYTYLTELEVDTRQTFADLCDDLLLLNLSKNPPPGSAIPESEALTFNMTTLVTAWQDYFWKVGVSNKKNFNVTFTDISIEHGTGEKKGKDYNGAALYADEMMSYSELEEFFDKMDDDRSWCGKWKFRELSCALIGAIDKLHTKMLNKNNIHPIGSIVVSNSAPGGFGTWENKGTTYLSEKITEISGMTIGLNSGKVMNKNVSELENMIIKSDTTQIPKHEHKIEFEPPTGEGSGSNSGSAGSGFATVTALRTGKNPPGNFSGTCGHQGQTWVEITALVVPRDTNAAIEKGGEASGKVNAVSSEVTAVGQQGVNVSPKTFPLNGCVWERES